MDIKSTNEYRDLFRQYQEMEKIAVWLATCHAATAEHEGRLKAVSKSSKWRFINICHDAAKMLRAGYFIDFGKLMEKKEQVIDRCERAANELREEVLKK